MIDQQVAHSYEELERIIDDNTGELQNICITLENLDIQFDLQLEWIDNILRAKVIDEHNNTVDEQDKISVYHEIISISFAKLKKSLYLDFFLSLFFYFIHLFICIIK